MAFVRPRSRAPRTGLGQQYQTAGEYFAHYLTPGVQNGAMTPQEATNLWFGYARDTYPDWAEHNCLQMTGHPFDPATEEPGPDDIVGTYQGEPYVWTCVKGWTPETLVEQFRNIRATSPEFTDYGAGTGPTEAELEAENLRLLEESRAAQEEIDRKTAEAIAQAEAEAEAERQRQAEIQAEKERQAAERDAAYEEYWEGREPTAPGEQEYTVTDWGGEVHTGTVPVGESVPASTFVQSGGGGGGGTSSGPSGGGGGNGAGGLRIAGVPAPLAVLGALALFFAFGRREDR